MVWGTYVSEVSIVDKLHQEDDIDEDLALGNLGNFQGSLLRAVQFILNSLAVLQSCWLAWQLQSLVKIRKVELEYQDGICKVICLAEFFELFG